MSTGTPEMPRPYDPDKDLPGTPTPSGPAPSPERGRDSEVLR